MPPIAKPKKQYKDKRPTRDDAVLEEIGEQLVEALKEESQVELTVWENIEIVRGQVIGMDYRTKLIYVQKHGETIKVPFMDIMKVESPK
ncbi:YolD-like family protein [Cohnella abietis]|uniref:YolD-like protein n=1 Tax=Cohnella abietis TaxID=2507935 RepID=A0A3T1D228_9BACL|nr:YolD-like family protein [Cohnella abietis]BBI32065.1 hypothetical protein KCTCHS21_14640 [Cohnella abietis]